MQGTQFLEVLLVEHPASDHFQVLKHTQVGPFLWPGLDVQIACIEKKENHTNIPKYRRHTVFSMLLCNFKRKMNIN